MPKALHPKKNSELEYDLKYPFFLLKNRMLYNYFATELFVWKRFGNSDLKESCFSDFGLAFPDRSGYPSNMECPVFLHHLQSASISRCGWKSCYRGLLCDDSARFIPSKKKTYLEFLTYTHIVEQLQIVMLEIFYVYYTSIYIYVHIYMYTYLYIHFNPSSSASLNPFSNGFIFLDTNSLCVR